MKVYLAGGLKSGWQDRIKKRLSLEGVVWIDPRNHNLTDQDQFTPVDIAGIEATDVLFAYLEKDNPGGYDLAFEIGYARALGKPVVLVLPEPRKYFRMPVAAADVVFESMEEGIWYLENLKVMIDGRKW